METNERKRFMPKDNDVTGHRKRVKERFLKTGFDSWQDYEILELILFYVIPRKDTKQTAKDLIKEFGSLKELMNADHDKLLDVLKDIDGAGPNTAFFFRFLKEISVKYSEFKMKDKNGSEYIVEWNQGKAFVISHQNKNKIQVNYYVLYFENVRHLMWI